MKQRTERNSPGLCTPSPKPLPILAQWETQNQGPSHHSPDILPRPLPDDAPPAGSRDSTTHTHTLDVVAESGHIGSALGLDIGNDGAESPVTAPVEEGSADSPVAGPVRSGSVSTSTDTITSNASTLYQSILESGYLSALDPNDTAAKYRDERRYRMLLQHDYHTIRGYFRDILGSNYAINFFTFWAVTLPLWKPCRVELGAVGFLSKPEGRFETLFNAYNPGPTSDGKADELPMLSGYGKVSQGSQRQDKRNAALRSFDRVQGLFSSAYVQPF
jgi:abelson tyrosine-protein kinase 1